MNYLNAATQYHAAGLKVVPFYKRQDGSVTFPAAYAKYRTEQSREDIETLFSTDAAGIALLCTDGIEAFDIDVKHDPEGNITSQFLENLKTSVAGTNAFQKCVIQRTKSGGWHIIYRCSAPAGNQKLTYRAGSKEAVIETRGEGGLLFIAPTPNYEVKLGSLSSIGTLTDTEREIFFRCAEELNERQEEEPSPPAPTHPLILNSGTSPGDAYNERHSVLDVAQRYGWTIAGRAGKITRLNKPGASNKRDIHASIVHTKTGGERFYPFTTATAYDPEKCYSAFGMYAVEEHAGDFSAAARALAGQGYGSGAIVNQAPAPDPVPEEKIPELISCVQSSRFDYEAEIREEQAILQCHGPNGLHKVGGFGQIGVFTGHEKSGKSFVLGCLASSAISGQPVLNFQMDRQGRKIIWFDTEQSAFFFQWTQKRIHDMAGKRQNLPYYQAYHLRKLTPSERLAAIEYLIYREKGLGIVVIDGIVDLVYNYNDLPEVQAVINRLMKWTDELNILLLSVLHVNKGDGKIRGHIGTEIKNKCDFAVSVTKMDDVNYRISNPTNRYANFPSFEFLRNADGLPEYENNVPDSSQFPARQNGQEIPESRRPAAGSDVPF